MKKIAKLIIGLSVLTMLMVCMTTAVFAGTAEDNHLEIVCDSRNTEHEQKNGFKSIQD